MARRDGGSHTREGQLVAWLWDVMHSAKPLVSEEMAAAQAPEQLNLYLEAAA